MANNWNTMEHYSKENFAIATRVKEKCQFLQKPLTVPKVYLRSSFRTIHEDLPWGSTSIFCDSDEVFLSITIYDYNNEDL